MGQEFGASSPFQFFTDHTPDLGKLVTQGRRKEFQAFSEFADPRTRDKIPDPQALSTFLRSKLRLDEAQSPSGVELSALYQRLAHLRRSDPVLSIQDRNAMEAKARSRDVLAVRRWRGPQERLLLVNFGDTEWHEASFGVGWRVVFDSGQPTPMHSGGVTLATHSATILARDSDQV